MDDSHDTRDREQRPDEAAPARFNLTRQAFLRGSLGGAALLAAGLGRPASAAAHDPDEPVALGHEEDDDDEEQPVSPVKMEWLGWSHFRFTSPTGKVILTNPFITNPDSPVKLDDITQANLIVAADGHPDEIGSTIEIAQKTGAKVFSPGELQSWFIEQGVPQTQFPLRFAGQGDRLLFDGIAVYMVNSIHGSGLPKPTAQNPYGGVAAGFVIAFENGWTVYFAGSTAATADQALWAEMYQPHLAILHLSATHSPQDFAMQVRLLETRNRNLTAVMPHHLRASPGAGQPNFAEAQDLMDAMKLDLTITMPVIGQVYEFRPGARRRKRDD